MKNKDFIHKNSLGNPFSRLFHGIDVYEHAVSIKEIFIVCLNYGHTLYFLYNYTKNLLFVLICSGILLNKNSPSLTEYNTETLSQIASNSVCAFNTIKLAFFPTSIP